MKRLNLGYEASAAVAMTELTLGTTLNINAISDIQEIHQNVPVWVGAIILGSVLAYDGTKRIFNAFEGAIQNDKQKE